MTLGRVVGTVVATIKHPVLQGHKLLLVQPVDAQGKALGRTTLAVDVVQAGPGDTVLLLEEGNSSRMILGDSMAPVRSTIVGIVDAVSGKGER